MTRSRATVIGLLVLVATVLVLRSRGGWASSFTLDPADLRSDGVNPYFILEPGYVLELRDEHTRLVITVLDEVERIGGVDTRVVEERESEDGKLVEVSRNFFAISARTRDVFYFGEDVDVYEDGKVAGHEGAWRAGSGGAAAGLMMPGSPVVGARYYQEVAPGVAMDRAEVVTLDDTLTVPAGRFTRVLRTAESSPLEPGAREHKLYGPGVGLLRDGSAELVRFGTPATVAGSRPCRASAAGVSLDHVIVAVSDLERAGRAYQELGFTTKDGRLHPNGVRNRHVKLRGGTELELMTVAGEPGDDMARGYADILLEGEGGAYLALAASLDAVVSAAGRIGLAARATDAPPARYVTFPGQGLEAVFFLETDVRAADTDSLLTHANGASGLVQAWVEATPDLGRLLLAMGAEECDPVLLPDGREGRTYGVANGSLVVVPPAGDRRARPLGALLVGGGGMTRPEASRSRAVWLPPARTFGLWLGVPRSGVSPARESP